MQLIATKVIQEERLSICNKCDKKSIVNICKACGCVIPWKVKVPGAECPLGKWKKTSNTTYDDGSNSSGNWGSPK